MTWAELSDVVKGDCQPFFPVWIYGLVFTICETGFNTVFLR